MLLLLSPLVAFLIAAPLRVHGLVVDGRGGHTSSLSAHTVGGNAGHEASSQVATTCGRPGSEKDQWDYHDGGSSWDLGQCCIGQGQSPLNVTAAMAVQPDGKVLFHGYRQVENPVTMVNDGKVLVAMMEASFGAISLGSQYPTPVSARWDLWKVVVHTPSEHTFQGIQVPLELQLFHRKAGTVDDPPPPEAVAVVAVGFQLSPHSSSFLQALSQGGLPKIKGGETIVNSAGPAMLDFAELFSLPLPAGNASAPISPNSGSNSDALVGHFWHYFGSETTPPCRTGLQYLVRHDPLHASTVQVDRFKEAVHAIAPFHLKAEGNARRLQPACGRTVMLRSTQDISMQMDMEQKVPDQSFENALDNAASQQGDFEAAMSTPAPQYAACMAGLVTAERDLAVAKERKQLECAAVKKQMQQLEESGSGISRLAIGEQLSGQKSLCESQTQVVEALETQVTVDRQKCTRLRLASGTGFD